MASAGVYRRLACPIVARPSPGFFFSGSVSRASGRALVIARPGQFAGYGGESQSDFRKGPRGWRTVRETMRTPIPFPCPTFPRELTRVMFLFRPATVVVPRRQSAQKTAIRRPRIRARGICSALRRRAAACIFSSRHNLAADAVGSGCGTRLQLLKNR